MVCRADFSVAQFRHLLLLTIALPDPSGPLPTSGLVLSQSILLTFLVSSFY